MNEIAVSAIVKDAAGNLSLQSELRPAIARMFGAGEAVTVIVRSAEEEARRTLDQNAYLHAEPIKKFCAYTGYTPAQMKLVLLGEYYGWTTLANWDRVPVKASTSELTKKEMSEWIEWLIQFGAESGLNILPPEPDPRKRDLRVKVA